MQTQPWDMVGKLDSESLQSLLNIASFSLVAGPVIVLKRKTPCSARWLPIVLLIVLVILLVIDSAVFRKKLELPFHGARRCPLCQCVLVPSGEMCLASLPSMIHYVPPAYTGKSVCGSGSTAPGARQQDDSGF